MFASCIVSVYVFFFFQAEDGIRDKLVTGVQTCALPIFNRKAGTLASAAERIPAACLSRRTADHPARGPPRAHLGSACKDGPADRQICRAASRPAAILESCSEGGESSPYTEPQSFPAP